MDKKTTMTQLPVINTVLILLTIVCVIWSNSSILSTINKVETDKVGGKENYKLLQELYASDKFAAQQKQGIQQAIDQYNGANPSAQQPQGTAQAQQPQELSSEQVQKVIADVPLKGAKNPTIVMIEYSDLECPFCKVLHDSGAYKAVLEKYPTQVAATFKHYPLPFHVNAQKQAEAAECVLQAGGSDKFFLFLDEVFKRTTSNGQGFALDKLAPLAAELDLNQASIQKCIDDGTSAAKVAADLQEGQGFGVTGTPGNILLNVKTGKWIALNGAVPEANFMTAVETLLQ